MWWPALQWLSMRMLAVSLLDWKPVLLVNVLTWAVSIYLTLYNLHIVLWQLLAIVWRRVRSIGSKICNSSSTFSDLTGKKNCQNNSWNNSDEVFKKVILLGLQFSLCWPLVMSLHVKFLIISLCGLSDNPNCCNYGCVRVWDSAFAMPHLYTILYLKRAM